MPYGGICLSPASYVPYVPYITGSYISITWSFPAGSQAWLEAVETSRGLSMHHTDTSAFPGLAWGHKSKFVLGFQRCFYFISAWYPALLCNCELQFQFWECIHDCDWNYITGTFQSTLHLNWRCIMCKAQLWLCILERYVGWWEYGASLRGFTIYRDKGEREQMNMMPCHQMLKCL